ncbi:MAG: hypothetical protein WC994_03600 [Brumimicrobium sp.]
MIYFKSNQLTDELISIGLLAGGDEGPFMYISKNRMNLLKKTLHSNTFGSLKRHLTALKNKIDQHRNHSEGLRLFDPVFSSNNLKRLSKSIHGNIIYSEPITINDWLNFEVFENLIYLFFNEKEERKTSKHIVFTNQWRAYCNSKKFDKLEKNVVLNELNQLLASTFSIDMIDKSKKTVYQGFDFDWSELYYKRKIDELNLALYSLKEFQFVIVYPNPRKKDGKVRLKEFKSIKTKLIFKDFVSFKNEMNGVG